MLYSLAFHARPRFTGNLDILIRPTAENAAKLIAALKECGFANPEIKAADLTAPDQVIQLGRPPNRIDLLTSISGVESEEAFSRKISAHLDDLPVSFLSKELLIATSALLVGRRTSPISMRCNPDLSAALAVGQMSKV